MNTFLTQLISSISIFLLSPRVMAVYAQTPESQFKIDTGGLPVLGIGDLLTFVIRLIFIIAGIAALLYGLWGGLSWITSGGDKDAIGGARNKIQAAVVGIFVLIIVLTIIWTLETVIFNRAICFGISCNIRIPGLNITPLPAESCSDICFDVNKSFRNGGCSTTGSCATGWVRDGAGDTFCSGGICCCQP